MKNRGFTLVEIIAAMVLLIIAIIPLVQLFAHFNETVSYRQNAVIISNLLSRKMEEIKCIKAQNFSALVDDPIGSSYNGFSDYLLTVQTTPNWTSNLYLTRVDVTATWDSPRGETLSETLSTLVADQ